MYLEISLDYSTGRPKDRNKKKKIQKKKITDLVGMES